MDFYKADVSLDVGGKQVKFSVIHNLPETSELSFENAFENWMHRTDTFTAKSLVKYINSKNTGYTAMTEKKYNKLCKKLKPIEQ